MAAARAKHVNDFGKDSVPSLVLRISIPFMVAQFVNVLYSIVDRIYIGNIPSIGAISLAGAGVCAPIITLLSSFATLIGIVFTPALYAAFQRIREWIKGKLHLASPEQPLEESK